VNTPSFSPPLVFPPLFPSPIWSFSYPGPNLESTLILARPDTPNLFILNWSAAFIWSALRHVSTMEALISKYAAHYGIPDNQASIDIETTLDSWSETLLAPANSPIPVPPMPCIPDKPHFSGDYKFADFHFRVAVYDPDFAEEILPRIAHLRFESHLVAPTTTFHAIYHDGHIHVFTNSAPLTVQSDASVARTVLLQEIARLAHIPNTQFLAILHAAAVGLHGQTLLLAAPTNSGKSTLAAALMHAGFYLFSDDSAPIDPSFRVVPAPFALMLRHGSWPLLTPYFPNLAEMPIITRHGEQVRFLPPPPVLELGSTLPKAIIYINFQRNSPPIFEPLSPFQSVLELQKSGFYVTHTEPAITAFLQWFQTLPAYQLTYSALSDAISLLGPMLLGQELTI
jgi:hypothetical protein